MGRVVLTSDGEEQSPGEDVGTVRARNNWLVTEDKAEGIILENKNIRIARFVSCSI